MADENKHDDRRARIEALNNHPQLPVELTALLAELADDIEALKGDTKTSKKEPK